MKAFTGATIHMHDGSTINEKSILVDQGKFVSISSEIPSDAEIINCKGQHITPGFVDAHTHTGIWEEGAGPGPGNHDGNEMKDPISPYVRVIDSVHPEDIGFEDARSSGVTTVGVAHGSGNAMGGQMCVLKTWGKEVDEMVIKEPAGIKLAFGENPKRAGETRGRAPNTRMGVAYLVRDAFYKAKEYMAKWEKYERLRTEGEDVDPPKFDIGMDALAKVLRREIPIRCHGHRADDIRTAIRIAEEFGLRMVIDHGTEAYKIKDTIIRKGIPLAIGPMIGWRAKRELRDMKLENPGIMVKEGALVAIMTDSPFTPIHHLRDSMIVAIRAGLPQKKALATITINPAKILEVEDKIGSIEPGKDADLVIFDGDPFDARSRVISTYINGEIVHQNTR